MLQCVAVCCSVLQCLEVCVAVKSLPYHKTTWMMNRLHVVPVKGCNKICKNSKVQPLSALKSATSNLS